MIKKEKVLWGALLDPIDNRDLVYEDFIAGKARPEGMPTFEVGYDVEEVKGKLRDEHQDHSYRCVSEGGTADMEMDILARTKKQINLSQRDAYSQIYGPNGGANPRDFYKLARKKGICEDKFCPSYPADGSKVTEKWTRQRGNITQERLDNALEWRIGPYRSIVSLNLDVMAQAIFENNGCGGAYKPINNRMGHMIFFKGYGMYKGYFGLKYRDSYNPHEKWIVKHNGKFYYASTNNPLAMQIKLYSIWTAEPGNYSKKKDMTQEKLNKLYYLGFGRSSDNDNGAKPYLNHENDFVIDELLKSEEHEKIVKILEWAKSNSFWKIFLPSDLKGTIEDLKKLSGVKN